MNQELKPLPNTICDSNPFIELCARNARETFRLKRIGTQLPKPKPYSRKSPWK